MSNPTFVDLRNLLTLTKCKLAAYAFEVELHATNTQMYITCCGRIGGPGCPVRFFAMT